MAGGPLFFGQPGSMYGKRALEVACGQCIGCRLQYRQEWASRIMHESRSHSLSSFVTLTYEEGKVPLYGSLCYRHVQLFLKRLRFSVGQVRFVACGEYGPKTLRPHYHLILFGYSPRDQKWCAGSAESPLYSSAELDKLWGLGQTRTGALTHETAGYVAGYVVEKLTGEAGDEAYQRVVVDTGEVVEVDRPFLRMSTRPPIGVSWYVNHLFGARTGGFGDDGPLSKGKVLVNGKLVKQPRAYDKFLSKLKPELLEKLKASRLAEINENSVAPDRLRARAAIARARMDQKGRRGDY